MFRAIMSHLSFCSQICPRVRLIVSFCWEVIIRLNFSKYSGVFATRAEMFVTFAYPLTSGFNSNSLATVTSARFYPISSQVTKKLFPRSCSVTIASSTTVNSPIAGSTRFLRISVASPLEPSIQIWLVFRARCP
jgi:hypothetical protein